MAAAASGPAGLVSPLASGAGPVCYEELPGQSCGVSLRGLVKGEGAGEGYPENRPAGGLVHSPPLKSLRGHTHTEA